MLELWSYTEQSLLMRAARACSKVTVKWIGKPNCSLILILQCMTVGKEGTEQPANILQSHKPSVQRQRAGSARSNNHLFGFSLASGIGDVCARRFLDAAPEPTYHHTVGDMVTWYDPNKVAHTQHM